MSSTNKTDNHDKTEILLKVALNTITLTITPRGEHAKHYTTDVVESPKTSYFTTEVIDEIDLSSSYNRKPYFNISIAVK
jgi:hypothetical protein